MTRYLILLIDGTTVTGEYVGAQDGYLYLSDGDDLRRVDQRHIVNLVSKDTPNE